MEKTKLLSRSEDGATILNKPQTNKGFTLIELMIVVAIIGILASIAIPNFLKFQAKSKQSEAKANLGAIFTAQISYFGEKISYGNFDVISWSISGTPRYHYCLDIASGWSDNNANNRGALIANAPVPATWTTNLNNELDTNGTAVVPIPPTCDNAKFTAGAGGKISAQNYSDGWSMNHLRQLVWTVDGT
jgi:type IV pilus assembly protein PilA